jgi:hypothetical protein
MVKIPRLYGSPVPSRPFMNLVSEYISTEFSFGRFQPFAQLTLNDFLSSFAIHTISVGKSHGSLFFTRVNGVTGPH